MQYNVPAKAVGCRVRETLQPAVDGAEVLRFYDLPQPMESMPIDPHGEYDVWVGETEDTAYLAVSALQVLAQSVERLIATFERHD